MERPCAICREEEPTRGLVIGGLKQTGLCVYSLTLDGLNLCPICPKCADAVSGLIHRFLRPQIDWDIEYEALFEWDGGYFGPPEENEQQAEVVGGECGA